jgi:hypothetical protein
MRQVPLKSVTVIIGGNPQAISYREQIAEIIRHPDQAADLEEVRRGIRVLDALEAATGGVLMIEDADFDHMVKRIKSARWPIVDKFVLDFVRDVTECES